MDAIQSWLATEDPSLTLGGFAGSGKTTIISELLRTMRGQRVAVCAFTGKAASVLRSKGVDASTMHRLIYAPESWCSLCQHSTTVEKVDDKATCTRCNKPGYVSTRWIRAPFIDAELVIVDEASMLNSKLVVDIEELAPKILYVGDHGQLEPIGDDPGLMHEPDIRLETIHRQAEGSGIIQFAHHVRTGSHPSRWDGKYDDVHVRIGQRPTGEALSKFDAILCGYNNTRVAVNAAIRKQRGYTSKLPEVGERLICLQNDKDIGIFNGLLVTVLQRRASDDYPRYDIEDDSGQRYFDVRIHPDQFGEEKKLEWVSKGLGLFEFGYCMTAHKSQGSEWEKVAVLEQLARSWDAARWRYTAATRASKYLEYWLPK